MEWRALEEHFRIAATQDPGPFGENAFEWDHSRYARGIGLTAEPGVSDLPHRACAVLALPAARWDVAEAKYRAWAAERGWGLWRIGARPTVAAPDAVVYALGVRASGSDSLLFARAVPPVVPAMGRRQRSEAMSIALTPGERWLIATDRVRRRMRAEIAVRGLVLFVEEAEWLTPAGLALLAYLLDAHRAWQARMLSRPANVYVVLATPPEREGSVVRMLERFGLVGHPPVARERRRDEKLTSGFSPPALRDIEEEYLYGALAAAPAALAEEDVRGVFGASAVDRCRAMAERGLFRVRTEAGETCYLPNPALPSDLAAPSPRAQRALAARYRQRSRRGHEHLALARAALSLDLGDPLRAVAAVARMPYTAGAFLPLRSFEALEATLERARPRLHADHASAWFSLAAHQRTFDHARDLAQLIADRELRTWKEMLRVVEAVLCTGRMHLENCLPPDFWPRLKSRRLAGPFMDATCVLAEMFWRKRYLSDTDIRQRYEFACDCLARWERPRSAWFERLERIVLLITYRGALQLTVPSRILSHGNPASEPQETLRTYVRKHQVAAYILASPAFAEAAMGYVCPPRSLDYRDRFVATALTSTTGQPEDMAASIGPTVGYLASRGLRLLLVDVLDDLLLLLARRPNPIDRHEFGRQFLPVAGGRASLMGANALYLAHGQRNVPGLDASAEGAAASALMFAGDLAGAHDRLKIALAAKVTAPLGIALPIAVHIMLCRKALARDLLASADAIIDRNRAVLTPDLCDYLVAYLEGSRALSAGDLDLAQERFRTARNSILCTLHVARSLKVTAAWSSYRACRARDLVKSFGAGRRGTTIWCAIRALCAGPEWARTSSLRARAALSLDYLWWVLDAWSKTVRESDDLLRLAFFLKDPVDAVFRPLGQSLLGLMAEWAPTLYERLRAATRDRVGDLEAVVPETRALSTTLRAIEETWKDGHMAAIDDRCGRILVAEGRSVARQARAADATWYEDAATYAQLRDRSGAVRSGRFSVVVYGHVGSRRAAPLAATLDFRVARLDQGAFEVDVRADASARPSLGRRTAGRSEPATFVGQSEAAKKVRAMIDVAARCAYPVLLLGETGVGKDLVARCIHAASASCDRAVVVADCASIAESLLESELFGHEKGAFTGAHGSHAGVFERADGSSLLLDEVDTMSPRMQVALLRVLETREYRPVGASTPKKSEFRLISAALPRLLEMTDDGRFRKDLFFRISTLRIEVPPLREREGDAREIAIAHARSLGFHVTAGALRVVASYEWPGNVRQLRHCIQAASLHANDRRIGEAAIGDVIAGYRTSANAKPAAGRGLDAAWQRALRALEGTRDFGAWDFARAAELSRRSAQRHLARLLRDGRIARLGAGRTTRYALRA